MKDKNTIIVGVATLIVGLCIGHFGTYARGTVPRNAGTFSRMSGMGNFGMRAGMGGGFVTGTVASKDATSITIDTRDGSSKVVLTNPSTSVAKNVSGSLADVMVGNAVTITGTANSDGSLLASLIQIRPASSTPMMGR